MIRILSWNIQEGRGCDGITDFGRIAEVIRKLGAFDVICLQEVSRRLLGATGFVTEGEEKSPGADQAAEIASHFPRHAVVYGSAIERAEVDGNGRFLFGNMVLSRLPVLTVFRHRLPRPAEPGKKHMPRQATEVTVGAPWGPLRIVTTHLEYYSQAHRIAQVEYLMRLHREVAGNAARPSDKLPDGPYADFARPATAIVCGDFNFETGSPEYRTLTSALPEGLPPLTDAWMALRRGEPHAATCGVHDRAQWQQGPHARDFFFVTPDIVARATEIGVDAVTDASDHQPMWLDVG